MALENSEAPERTSGTVAGNVILAALVLIVGVAIGGAIIYFEPTAQRNASTRESAMLVDTVPAESGTFRPTITAMGTVVPVREVRLESRVRGEVIERSEQLVPGGFVRKGDVLARLDRVDYENQLAQRESERIQAESDLAIELGRQQAARMEFELLGEEIPESERALLLREPQIRAARARVAVTTAAEAQAQLDLDRTTIVAPFDAQVLERQVDLGSQVAPGDELARLIGIESYWVEATVPLSHLDRLSFATARDPESASPTRVRSRAAWPEGVHRVGRLVRLIGALEEQTRMARVLVEVEDPVGYYRPEDDRPPLLAGSYVEVSIDGKAIPDCVRLRRELVRKNQTAWVRVGDALDIRSLEVAFQDGEYAYVTDGLSAGDLVVTTNLATVAPGAKLREDNAPAAAETP